LSYRDVGRRAVHSRREVPRPADADRRLRLQARFRRRTRGGLAFRLLLRYRLHRHPRIGRGTPAGSIVAAGSTGDTAVPDAWILEFDSSCAIAWQQVIDGGNGEFFNSVSATPHGGYIAAGETASYSGSKDFYAVGVDAWGYVESSAYYGGSGTDSANHIAAISTGGYILAGYSESYGPGQKDYLLIRLNSQGLCPGCF